MPRAVCSAMRLRMSQFRLWKGVCSTSQRQPREQNSMMRHYLPLSTHAPNNNTRFGWRRCSIYCSSFTNSSTCFELTECFLICFTATCDSLQRALYTIPYPPSAILLSILISAKSIFILTNDSISAFLMYTAEQTVLILDCKSRGVMLCGITFCAESSPFFLLVELIDVSNIFFSFYTKSNLFLAKTKLWLSPLNNLNTPKSLKSLTRYGHPNMAFDLPWVSPEPWDCICMLNVVIWSWIYILLSVSFT